MEAEVESFAALEETEDRLGPTAAEDRGGRYAARLFGRRAVRPLRRHLPELALGLGCAVVLIALLASI
ncbi:MAG: hypothetical protein HOH66_05565 [Rhodospirillaceae bacterium]|jgi:hypothetical protein|nr:hypothetical protein [Rhodospirillaceae bacterium]MBT6117315.1 hypothetical protein [Rhodospirillaceae bacterium]